MYDDLQDEAEAAVESEESKVLRSSSRDESNPLRNREASSRERRGV